MFRRNLALVWFGIIVLCGMFLFGQETWMAPPTFDALIEVFENTVELKEESVEVVLESDEGAYLEAYWNNIYDAYFMPGLFTGSKWIAKARKVGSSTWYQKPVPKVPDYATNYVTIDLPSTQCADNDEDGYGYPGSSACTYAELDCNDSDPNIHPNAPDSCDDVDQDCDGADGVPELCGNNIDDDCDGKTDCTPGQEDPDCNCASGSCIGTVEASTYQTSPGYGASDLGKHLSYFLLPLGALIGLMIWWRKR